MITEGSAPGAVGAGGGAEGGRAGLSGGDGGWQSSQLPHCPSYSAVVEHHSTPLLEAVVHPVWTPW